MRCGSVEVGLKTIPNIRGIRTKRTNGSVENRTIAMDMTIQVNMAIMEMDFSWLTTELIIC